MSERRSLPLAGELRSRVDIVADQLLELYLDPDAREMQHIGSYELPSEVQVEQIVQQCRSLLFPGYAGPDVDRGSPGALRDIIRARVIELRIALHRQVYRAAQHKRQQALGKSDLECAECADKAESISAIYSEMEERLRTRLGVDRADIRVVRTFDGRLTGQTWETPFITVPAGPIDPAAMAVMVENFHREYETRWGNRFEHSPVQGVTYRVEAMIQAEKVRYTALAPRAHGTVLLPKRLIEIRYLSENPTTAGEYHRNDLAAGDVIAGPAVIREALSTTFILGGQQLTVGTYGELRITQADDGNTIGALR